MLYLSSFVSNNNATILDGSQPSAIAKAVSVLRRDSLVAIPTETVYGLAARATSPMAIRKIFVVKGRPISHPLILHIAKTDDLQRWATDIPPLAQKLVDTFWPGPLTIVVKRSANVCDEITGGRDTVAIRCPDHKVTTELLARLDDAIVAPSANRFGKVSPTTANHVANDLGRDVEVILDGGDCKIGLESTIVDCTTHPPQILRAGAITVEAIERVCQLAIDAPTGESRASGMLEKHYAPNCIVELAFSRKDAEARLANLVIDGRIAEIFDFGSDLEKYAHELYSRLREADKRSVDVVVVVKPPMTGIGIAINERLKKASNSAVVD